MSPDARSSSAPTSARRLARRAAPWAALLVVTLATYANAVGNRLTWDDHQVVEKPLDRPLPGAREILTSPDVLVKSDPAAYYRPLTRGLIVVDAALYGRDPRPYHLENILLHAGVALLLFALARRIVGATAPALAAAVLFAVHPVNAEAVNVVANRNNMLAGAFTLSAALAYLAARRSGAVGARWLAAVLFLCGLLSKETAAMLLPFLTLEELRSNAPWRSRVREGLLRLLPLVGATAVYLAVRSWVLPRAFGAPLTVAGVGIALARDLHVVPRYLWLLVFPAGLTVHHAAPESFLASPLALGAAWAVIVAGTVLLWRTARPATRFGLLWFAVNLLPVSGIVPIPSAPTAERYLYLPAMGLFLVVGDQLARLRERAGAVRVAAAAAVACAAAALGATTVRRNLEWHDDVSLFASAVRVDPSSADASYNLALALAAVGDAEGARREWERTLALDPANVGALSQLGTYHAERGELGAAGAYIERVLVLDPRDVEARFNMGLLLERNGRPREALAQYEAFLALDPVDYPELVPRVQERVRSLRAAAAR